MNILNSLNDKQAEAVKHTEGPLLILAGAGSGKTTVLVNRIAYLIYENNVKPYNILSITFTNKAAREMKERVEKMIGDTAYDIWMGTFHSVCVRILRGCIDKEGYGRNFIIYDTSDSVSVMKECMKELNISDKNFPVKTVLSKISRAKDDMISPQQFENIHVNDYFMFTISKLYNLYQKKLKNNNALDFDDIIYLTVKILNENPEILEKYQKRFKYIMVDEYQDTNNVQYKLISILAGKYRNLCVVGDDDQSIYKFRGANIRNILDFEKEFSDAVTIRLEQNYRSTQIILDAANNVISNNQGRKGKNLWTDNSKGTAINYFTAANEYDEGGYIAKSINKLVKNGYRYGDCAILYRTNVQSRVLEEMMLRNALPYRILAGLRFYDRKEIKDIVAYLKILYNPHDDVSLKRIINEPKRGIGLTTVEKASQLAAASGNSLFDVFSAANDIPELSRAASKINLFMDIMRNLMLAAMSLPLSELVKRVMEDTGYITMLNNENTVESKNRIENLEEFMTVVNEHIRTTENADLGSFIESISLISDIDSYDEEQDAVVLMTIHSAKGLEFPNVFLAGMENGIFPGIRSMESREDMEEERRLCYVAITRAKENLYITNTKTRNMYGKPMINPPSEFITEIPENLINHNMSSKAKLLHGLEQIGITYENTDNYTQRYSDNHKNVYTPEIKQTLQQSTERSDKTKDLNFKKGDKVIHKKFGCGVIMEAQPIGNDVKLLIDFEKTGPKHLMAVFANLKKI